MSGTFILLGRRIARLNAGYDALQTQWASQRCIYDGVTLIEDRLYDQTHPDDGKLLGRYFYEAAINKLVSVQIPTIDGLGLNEYIALTDDRGTIMGTADAATGQIVERLHYNSTGIAKVYDANDQPILRADGRNLGRSQFVPFGYTGMYKESFTGFLHTHFRDYDPIHRTWLSEDPAGYVDGLNLNRAYFDVNGADELGLNSYWDDFVLGWGLITDLEIREPLGNGQHSLNLKAKQAGGGNTKTLSGELMHQLGPGARDFIKSQQDMEMVLNYAYAAHNGTTEAGKQVAIEAASSPLYALGFGVAAKLGRKGYILVKNSEGVIVVAKKLKNGGRKLLSKVAAAKIIKEVSEEVIEKAIKLIPGVDLDAVIWRYEFPDRLPTTWKAHSYNVATDHRYSKKGVGAVYGSLTKATARHEVGNMKELVGRVATRRHVRLSNMLDLRDPSARQLLGVTIEDITSESYEIT